MSSGTGIALAKAQKVAGDLLLHLDDVTAWHCVAGSVRREKSMVNDIEIVVRPANKSALLNRLDVLVHSSVIEKARYGKQMTHRWGEFYRGMRYQGVLIEVFICDEHNQGYIQWLRTGEGVKNTYVMNRLIACHAPVRFNAGYGWHVSYDKKHANYDAELGYAKLGKLIIPNEYTLYFLLGMEPILPKFRTEKVYRRHLDKWVYCPDADVLEGLYVPELKQKRLFD